MVWVVVGAMVWVVGVMEVGVEKANLVSVVRVAMEVVYVAILYRGVVLKRVDGGGKRRVWRKVEV